MLDRTELDPVFFAPFVSSLMHVEPQWIDYNGHLNMAYYNVLFDRAVDEVYELIGIGPIISSAPTIRPSLPKCMCAMCAKFTRTTPVRVTFQLIDYDSKRIHYFEELFHATEGWVSATSENMALHVDMAAKKVAPFPNIGHAVARAHEFGRACGDCHARKQPGVASRCPGGDALYFPAILAASAFTLLSTINSIGTVCLITPPSQQVLHPVEAVERDRHRRVDLLF